MYREKNRTSIFTLSLIIFRLICFSQEIQTNQFDSTGKRTGKWLVYLDKAWKETNDTNNAPFKVYELFLNGKRNYNGIGEGKIKYRLEHTSESKLMNGEYKWYNKNNKLLYSYNFENGEILNAKKYAKNGEVESLEDFTISYNNETYSFGMYFYSQDKGTRNMAPFYIYRKGDRGWGFYPWNRLDPKVIAKPK